jgi:hypothetical protein
MVMNKIEYKVINKEHLSLNEESLNELGKDGWQLVKTTDLIFVFMRPSSDFEPGHFIVKGKDLIYAINRPASERLA